MPVLVAARDIPLHTVISVSDVLVAQVPPELLPSDALSDPQTVPGHLTTVDIAQGEIILARRLITPTYTGPRAAFVMSPTQVIYAIPTADLLSSMGIVRPADHIDLLFSFDFGKASQRVAPGVRTFACIQDLRVAAVIYPIGTQEGAGAPQAILLALEEQDAALLKFFRDSGAGMDMVLRSPVAEGLFDVVTVDGDYVVQRYNIPEETRQWQ